MAWEETWAGINQFGCTNSQRHYSLPKPQPQQCRIQTASATCTTAQGNAGSLTHWAKLGIKPASSWKVVRFLIHWAMTGPSPLLLSSCFPSVLWTYSLWLFWKLFLLNPTSGCSHRQFLWPVFFPEVWVSLSSFTAYFIIFLLETK